MNKVTLLTSKSLHFETDQRVLSIFVELDATRILLNCGYGVLQSLLEIGIQHRTIDHIILTHFQPQYVADLLPFLHANAQAKINSRDRDLHIYGRSGIQYLVGAFMNIFQFHPTSYNIIFHEIIENCSTPDTDQTNLFSTPISKNLFFHLSIDKDTNAIIQHISCTETCLPLLNHTELVIVNADLIEDGYLIDFAASTQVRRIIYSSSYNKSNTFMLQKMAEDKGYKGTIYTAYNLMSFIL